MKEFFFISGLPRSGSTLLSAILRQNPEFYADILSPVQGLVTTGSPTITVTGGYRIYKFTSSGTSTF